MLVENSIAELMELLDDLEVIIADGREVVRVAPLKYEVVLTDELKEEED